MLVSAHTTTQILNKKFFKNYFVCLKYKTVISSKPAELPSEHNSGSSLSAQEVPLGPLTVDSCSLLDRLYQPLDPLTVHSCSFSQRQATTSLFFVKKNPKHLILPSEDSGARHAGESLLAQKRESTQLTFFNPHPRRKNKISFSTLS